jgi:hypothetical protein
LENYTPTSLNNLLLPIVEFSNHLKFIELKIHKYDEINYFTKLKLKEFSEELNEIELKYFNKLTLFSFSMMIKKMKNRMEILNVFLKNDEDVSMLSEKISESEKIPNRNFETSILSELFFYLININANSLLSVFKNTLDIKSWEMPIFLLPVKKEIEMIQFFRKYLPESDLTQNFKFHLKKEDNYTNIEHFIEYSLIEPIRTHHNELSIATNLHLKNKLKMEKYFENLRDFIFNNEFLIELDHEMLQFIIDKNSLLVIHSTFLYLKELKHSN